MHYHALPFSYVTEMRSHAIDAAPYAIPCIGSTHPAIMSIIPGVATSASISTGSTLATCTRERLSAQYTQEGAQERAQEGAQEEQNNHQALVGLSYSLLTSHRQTLSDWDTGITTYSIG